MALDGPWADYWSIIVASVAALQRSMRRWIREGVWTFDVQESIVDALTGTTIVPFALMVSAAFSTELLKSALESNKLYMSIGGLIGLLVTINLLFKQE